MNKFIKTIEPYSAHLAWAVALTGSIGSLYFSEIRDFLPCILCWYQRVVLYPLVLILPIGIFSRDKNLHRYALPFSSIGIALGTYHILVQEGVIPEALVPCTAGVSCATKHVILFDFITIPMLSTAAFVLMTALLIIHSLKNKEKR